MNYKVTLTPTAEANLDEIFHVIALDNMVAARKFVASMRRAMMTLRQNPKRCPFAPEDGLEGLALRHLIFGNYRVIFTIAPGNVTVLQIRHAARRPIDEG